MDLWAAMLDILILLLGAMLLGALFDRLKQSPILGYLLAGTLLGPNALDLMPNHEAIASIAELGLALLLFSIGLEFSWKRLRALGLVALGGGAVQIVGTLAIVAGVCAALGVAPRPALAIGAMVALSSTACVLRLLATRREMESVHGRSALGVLLTQDIAVIPLVLIVAALRTDGSGTVLSIGAELGRAVVVAGLLVGALYLLLYLVMPRVLGSLYAARNREFSVLLAVVTPLATAWAAHKLGLSPVLGAFIAGMMLGESPFAAQINADVAPMRALFVTLFFGAIGMLANPAWVLEHWLLLAGVVLAVLVGKTLITAGAMRLFRVRWGYAVATGLCLAQVGEFSFVIAEVARDGQLLSDHLFELILATTIVTLFVTPLLVAVAPRAALLINRQAGSAASQPGDGRGSDQGEDDAPPHGHLIIIGFGPCGRLVAEELLARGDRALVVLELNAKSTRIAHAYGLRAIIGDATSADVLDHAGVRHAGAIIVTIPDPAGIRRIVAQIRAVSPEVPIITRARYHAYCLELMHAGATVVVDEEQEVGRHMASAIEEVLGRADPSEPRA